MFQNVKWDVIKDKRVHMEEDIVERKKIRAKMTWWLKEILKVQMISFIHQLFCDTVEYHKKCKVVKKN